MTHAERPIAAFIAASMLFAMPAAAQESPSDSLPQTRAETDQQDEPDRQVPAGEAIVVQGERGELHVEAREQARAITPRTASIASPLARMQRPVCPGVFGAEEASALQIISRIRRNAELVGLEALRGVPCDANVVIAFVDDPLAEFEQLRSAKHYLADGLDFGEAKRVREIEGPVLAWNVVTTRTRDGMLASGDPPVFASTAISRTELGVREDIEISVVMIQRDRVAGLDPVAIADYATMRALAKTDPPETATTFGTVLELFSDGVEAPPYELTAFDIAYLTSLYRSQANQPASLAMRDVGDLMERLEN